MIAVTPKFLPKITLESIYGSNFILNPRASFTKFGWLPDSQARLDFLTGAPLTITGNMPAICSHSVVTANVSSLLSMANLEAAPCRQVYCALSDYHNVLKLIRKQQKKLVVNHLHPSNEIKSEDYWVNPKIVGFLNNKANLEYLVPLDYIPRRAVIPAAEIAPGHRTLELPCVVKAATEQPTGGGYGVFICNNTADVDCAYQRLKTCKAVILEEYLEIEKNYCVQFASTLDGRIIYLGASEQLTDSAGFYYGNWLTRDQGPPQQVTDLGRFIMETACRFGYIGIGGFDIVISKDNRVLAIDLNFRLNGSTPALLLQDSIFKGCQASVLLFRNWKTKLNWCKFLAICRENIERSHLVPLSLYDPLSGPCSDSIYYFSGILTGTSKEDVLLKELNLAKQGLW